jgi:hypothetical protein
MPIFKKPGEGYNATLWKKDTKHLAPTKADLLLDPNYGKISVWTWDYLKDFVNGRVRRPEELPERPRREGGEGGHYKTRDNLEYFNRDGILQAVDALLDLDLNRLYEVEFRPRREMELVYGDGVLAHEKGNWALFADDMDLYECIEAKTHEMGAKRVRARRGYFDHTEKNEHIVEAEAEDVLKEYILKALKMRN